MIAQQFVIAVCLSAQGFVLGILLRELAPQDTPSGKLLAWAGRANVLVAFLLLVCFSWRATELACQSDSLNSPRVEAVTSAQTVPPQVAALERF